MTATMGCLYDYREGHNACIIPNSEWAKKFAAVEKFDGSAVPMRGASTAIFGGRRFLGAVVRMGDVLTEAWRDQIIAEIDATSDKAAAVEAFKAAHPFDLAAAIGDANLASWNNYWSLADSKSVEVFNLYDKLTQDKGQGVVSSWSSIEEGAFSGWKYAVGQLYVIANQPPVVTPNPTPVPPGTNPNPTTPKPKPATFPTWGLVAAGGAVVVGIAGGIAYWLSR